jgi:succinyl-CoA synthetase beta subunit
MIRELKIYQELRKQNKQAIKELLKIISKISKLAQALQPKELDLNPVILTKNKANIVDARIF